MAAFGFCLAIWLLLANDLDTVAVELALAARGLPLVRLRREWDSVCWPLATKGFFAFRSAIPQLTARLLPG